MKERVLITGSSSGIGLEFAKLFAKDGHDLVLVARQEDKLKAIAKDLEGQFGVSVMTIAKDLSIPSASDEIFDELKKSSVEVEILVNNAGFGSYGAFVKTDLKTSLEMIEVNVSALTHLTRLFLPSMIERGHGKILNVASLAAFPPGPYMNVYYSTKAYVLSFSVALNEELKGLGVQVTVLCPGPTDTNFQKRIGLTSAETFSIKSMSAEKVAKIGYKGLKDGKLIVIPGFINKLTAFALRFVPKKTAAHFVAIGQISRK
ncbi:SDR family NAD(P)-dependent oxidoreductase [Athalassotoga saccharophila]|uniref:SDR family NAD(P)-dependent oxidoreductase n=1 Tax=Athalassotoga saccharophila TaxID=1441386 RepID=UPI001379D1D8|nr:SDR family oxidoreductase [Athalassotoga saccharophila]BBJ29026.1 3-oxoacyl-[acyl-carrier protein] reductase [Athalassotoga saccharophila]